MSTVPARRRTSPGFALLALALGLAGLRAGNAFAGARAALSSTRIARSALDKDLVQSSWAEVCPDTSKETLTAVGTVIFDALFETDQSTKDLFSFGDRLNEAEQKKFDKHVAGFTQTVDKAVKGLDDIPTLLPVLNYLGERHAYHDVTKEHYDAAGKTLLAVLEKVLEPKGLWTPETKESWTEVWKVMDSEMRKGQGIA